MPASRSARAMTLAPRSWPSNPGFAITTRIFCIVVAASSYQLTASGFPLPAGSWTLYERHLFVLSPDFAKRVAHLADRGVGADAVHQGIHRVPRSTRGLLEHVERVRHARGVARLAQRLEAPELPFGRRLVDV